MTHLDRRSFLRMTAAAGLAVGSSPFVPRRAFAQEAEAAGYAGPYWVHVHLGGGWDPTLLCDPKGRKNEEAADPVNMYFEDEIEQVGPFRVAPVDGAVDFFTRFRDQLVVLNGVDAQTNSHETGTRYSASGSMDPGTPAFNALVAAHPDQPPSLSYLSHGGYDVTAGLVAPTRIPDTSSILSIAYPERLSPNDPDSLLLPVDQMERLRQARKDRLQRLHDQAALPRIRQSIAMLQQARSGDNELARLAEALPGSFVDTNNPLIRQAEVTMACFQAGVTMSANLSIGGFDTHGNHDASHTPRIEQVLQGLTFLWDEAERRGLADKLVVVVGSDFGRTPWYNDTQGKDHWSISSMMLMGAGIGGGRVIGATDERQVPIGVDPKTLKTDPNGIRVTYAHVHASLRELAGLQGWETAERFDVGDTLPLLG